jgi:hypothetical protein
MQTPLIEQCDPMVILWAPSVSAATQFAPWPATWLADDDHEISPLTATKSPTRRSSEARENSRLGSVPGLAARARTLATSRASGET